MPGSVQGSEDSGDVGAVLRSSSSSTSDSSAKKFLGAVGVAALDAFGKALESEEE